MTKNGYILSIDQGTTSSRAALISEDGNIISQKNIEFKQYFPNNGWVEHDPRDILSSTIDCIKYVINESKVKPEDIMTAGVTNQRETIVVWDKTSGDPVYNAIVWQDRRTEDICESALKLTEGFNKQEVVITPKKQNKNGFFERLFHLFR